MIPFAQGADAWALAHAIVDTVREPLVVLDPDLRVVAASRSFYSTFTVTPGDTQGKILYDVRDGEWDIPKLRLLLGSVRSHASAVDDCEIEQVFSRIGRRILRLNARQVMTTGALCNILLGLEDVTARLLEREKDELLRQKDIALGELHHRIGNSLQVIANIIQMKARSVTSEETRRHLIDAHDRVVSIAAVQQCLHVASGTGVVDLRDYLAVLRDAIALAMIGDNRALTLEVTGDAGEVPCRQAESIGLILTELVINALKHAFDDATTDGRIRVTYVCDGAGWRLAVSDNGRGKPPSATRSSPGLGRGIVEALARQIGAGVTMVSGPQGTTVSVGHVNG
jgi:chemotaxis protein methyltransferase CheR